jgi:Ca2+-binding RTX toxin-like protein
VNILRKSFDDRRRGFIGWAIGIIALSAFTLAFYPSIKSSPQFEDAYKQLPDALRSIDRGLDVSYLRTNRVGAYRKRGSGADMVRTARSTAAIAAMATAIVVTLRGADSVAGPPLCFGQPATIEGTPDDDIIVGTDEADTIVGLGGRDRIQGGSGNDRICGGAGSDRIKGGLHVDTLGGGRGADSILGGIQPDSFFGGPGDDRLNAVGNQKDILVGGPGDDVMEGGLGDTANYGEEEGPVTVDLAEGLATSSSAGRDTLIGIGRATGSAFDDRLLGSDLRNMLTGGDGSDVLRGLGGGDRLDGGADTDRLLGGAGNDGLFGGPGDDSLNGLSGDNHNDGGDGSDHCINPDPAAGAANCESP